MVIDKGVIDPYILMYHNMRVKPYWTDHYEISGQVGNHVFYKEKKRGKR